MKSEIIDILMRRDNIDEDEAQQIVEDVQNRVNEVMFASCDLDEIEEIIRNDLGLEPDFVEAFIF